MKVDPYEVQRSAIGTLTAFGQGAKFADVHRLLLDHLPDEAAPFYVECLAVYGSIRREYGWMVLRQAALDVARRQAEAV